MEIVLAVGLLVVAAALVGFGIWQLEHPALPGWVKGVWKWPLGANTGPPVPRLMGWSAILIGGACMPTAYVEATTDRTLTTIISALVAMLLVAAGIVPWIRAVFLSYDKAR